jgi:GTP-binding protein
LADLAHDEDSVVIAVGGRGGFGYAHFVSSRRQAPRVAEKGEPGEQQMLTLELKSIADVGLVGLPNAGKSTLLSVISNARPEIADYPFTTLTPNLGVVDLNKSTSLLVADIPGLIEGAAAGKGLGDEFLRHVERTAVLLHLIDAHSPDVLADWCSVDDELQAYGHGLASKPTIIVLTKAAGLDKKALATKAKALAENSGNEVCVISAQEHQGLPALLKKVAGLVKMARTQVAVSEAEPLLPVLKLANDESAWSVQQTGDGFAVTGARIERFAHRTDFSNPEGVNRLRDIMRKMGIMHELERQSINPGQTISVAGHHFTY